MRLGLTFGGRDRLRSGRLGGASASRCVSLRAEAVDPPCLVLLVPGRKRLQLKEVAYHCDSASVRSLVEGCGTDREGEFREKPLEEEPSELWVDGLVDCRDHCVQRPEKDVGAILPELVSLAKLINELEKSNDGCLLCDFGGSLCGRHELVWEVAVSALGAGVQGHELLDDLRGEARQDSLWHDPYYSIDASRSFVRGDVLAVLQHIRKMLGVVAAD